MFSWTLGGGYFFVVVTFYGFQEQVKELQLRHAAEAGGDGLALAGHLSPSLADETWWTAALFRCEAFQVPWTKQRSDWTKIPLAGEKARKETSSLRFHSGIGWMCWDPQHGWETYYLRLSSGRDKSYRSILMYLDRLGCTGECSIRHNLTQKVLERGNVILWFFDLRATAAISMGGLFIMPQRLLLGEITPCYCAMVLTLFISRWFQGNLKRMLLVSMFMHSSMLLPRSPIIVSIQISNTSSIPADISGEGGALSSRAPN